MVEISSSQEDRAVPLMHVRDVPQGEEYEIPTHELRGKPKMIRLSSRPGTYAMVFRSRRKVRVRVGRWGHLATEPGYYIYIGSAFGPGGVSARVERHCRQDKREHWHIDYLREAVEPVFTLYCYSPIHLEHDWAQSIMKMKSITVIEGFGSSDCRCKSHLFYMPDEPDTAQLQSLVGVRLKTIWH